VKRSNPVGTLHAPPPPLTLPSPANEDPTSRLKHTPDPTQAASAVVFNTSAAPRRRDREGWALHGGKSSLARQAQALPSTSNLEFHELSATFYSHSLTHTLGLRLFDGCPHAIPFDLGTRSHSHPRLQAPFSPPRFQTPTSHVLRELASYFVLPLALTPDAILHFRIALLRPGLSVA